MFALIEKELKVFGGTEAKTVAKQIFQTLEKNGFKQSISHPDQEKIYNKAKLDRLAFNDGSYRTFLGT